jgi:hypothetical protein
MATKLAAFDCCVLSVNAGVDDGGARGSGEEARGKTADGGAGTATTGGGGKGARSDSGGICTSLRPNLWSFCPGVISHAAVVVARYSRTRWDLHAARTERGHPRPAV